VVEVMAKKTAPRIDYTDENHLMAELERLIRLRWSLMVDRKVTKANKVSDELFELEQRIPELPDKGRRMLLTLAQSPEEELRMVAADNLISLEPKTAKKLLSDLAKNASNVFIGIQAETTLDEWKAGRLATRYPRSFLG
jgi:uncharacterized protein YjeT (DUF2065 family)